MADQSLKETASQTAGPYVHIGLAPGAAGFDIYRTELGHDIAGANARGERIRIEGIVMDGMGEPVTDVLIEVWQANCEGIYPTANGTSSVEDGFRGWGRAISDFKTGEWGIDTIKPGSCCGPGGIQQAPHLNIWLVARGINVGLNTRLYFEDEIIANNQDPVLKQIENSDRRSTLIAKRSERESKPIYRFNIQLQGEQETVFFDI